ncbi:hypothetical protein Bca4012_042865 [Brassica carinata]
MVVLSSLEEAELVEGGAGFEKSSSMEVPILSPVVPSLSTAAPSSSLVALSSFNGGSELVAGGSELVNGGSELASWRPKIVNGGSELVNGGSKLVVEDPELVSCRPKLVNGGSKLIPNLSDVPSSSDALSLFPVVPSSSLGSSLSLAIPSLSFVDGSVSWWGGVELVVFWFELVSHLVGVPLAPGDSECVEYFKATRARGWTEVRRSEVWQCIPFIGSG